MMDKKKDCTKVWECYERGRQYNNSLTPNQYSLVNTNIEFFAGNQWINMQDSPAMSRLSKPVFNVIKRVVSLFVASLTSSSTSLSFEPLAYYDGENIQDPDRDASAFATAEVANLFEKFKMDYRIRDALFDGAQTGDYCAHFYWDANALSYGGAFGPYRGEICMELVDGLNVMFGNPNTCNVEDQPYILLVGRDTVENLREEARRHSKAGNEININAIQSDREYQYMAGQGGRTELYGYDDENGKALYCYMYYKVSKEEDIIDPKTGLPMMELARDKQGRPIPEKDMNGNIIMTAQGETTFKKKPMKQLVTTVHVTKATRNATIFEDVDTGLSRYPIAWGNWERQKNQYHGRALVTDVIPNQIFINSMFAMVFRHLQLLGFPKTIYNADLVSSWTNEVGQAIGIHGLQPNQGMDAVAYNLQPADMSNQIIATIDKAMAYTKDCLGATDAQLGNVRPDNTSALMVLQSSAEVPMENTRACLHEWIEDIGAILLDMMGTYYGERPVVHDRVFKEPVQDASGAPRIDPFTGLIVEEQVSRRVAETFDFSQFKHLWLNVRANVGASTYYSEIAMVQTLDNLKREGTMNIIQYLERMPDKYIPKKDKLLQELKEQMRIQADQRAQQQSMQMENGIIPGDDGQALGSMTEEQEAQAGAMEAMKHKADTPVNYTVGAPMNDSIAFSRLSGSAQGKFGGLPRTAQKALLNSKR